MHDDMTLLLHDYRLTTAEILYHMPDHPALLQSFIWQDYDLAPRYPRLNHFLGFWVEKIEGRLHSVYVARRTLIAPSECRHISGEILIH